MKNKKWILLLVCVCAGTAVLIGRSIRKGNDTVKADHVTESVNTQTPGQEEEKAEANDQENPNEQGSQEAEEVKEADWDAFNQVLSDIYNAMPGVSGCSLKAARAAGEALDWAKQYMAATDESEILQKAQSWYDENKEQLVELESIMAAWEAVYEDAKTIITDRDSILPVLDDAGYELQNDSYNAEDIEIMQNAFKQVFPEVSEEQNE